MSLRTAVGGLTAACCICLAPQSAQAETTQQQGIRLSLSGKLTPSSLPRRGSAPAAVAFSVRIDPTSDTALPQLRRISIAINHYGRLDASGLPRCPVHRIRPATSAEALAHCGRALVGRGRFSADVRLPESSPFPSRGRILAFNGRWRGRPAILAQIYGRHPAPTSYVLPFSIRRHSGTFGTQLEAALPPVTGDWGFVTSITLRLGRSYRLQGRRRSYLAAGCPAPAGFSAATFPLATTRLDFDGGARLGLTLTRSCQVAE